MTTKKSAGVLVAPDQDAEPAVGSDARTDAVGQDVGQDAGPDAGTDLSDGDSVDFVTFVVQEETYAFPMEQVEEIIRMPRRSGFRWRRPVSRGWRTCAAASCPLSACVRVAVCLRSSTTKPPG